MNEPLREPQRHDHLRSTPADSGKPEATLPATPSTVGEVQRPVHLGRFAVQRFHAKGGLGEVHVAVDEELHRNVALKRMQQRFAGDAVAKRRFLNEAEITAKLEHPGIVPIYGLVHDGNGQPCYAMRFIEGESLAEAIKRFHQSSRVRREPGYDGLAFRTLLQRFISVCQTIGYAHSKHVIHRDIKPANIMLGPFGETLVVDWGLARELADDSSFSREPPASADLPSTVNFAPSGSDDLVYTQAGQALGTPGYMAPEQAAGRWNVVGPCSDIYSLGATLYEMLTGERPIRGQDVFEALQKAQAGDFSAPRKVKGDVPKALEAICLKAMALKSENRFARAADLAADLEHWLADEPVTAWPEPWLVRGRRWLKRHRALVAGFGLTLVLAVIALSTVAVIVERARAAIAAEQDRTARQRARAEGNLAKALTAVDRMLTRVGERRLAHIPQFDEERRAILSDALKLYFELSDLNSDEPRVRLETGKSAIRMGDINQLLGRYHEAERAYQQAGSLLSALVSAHPEEPGALAAQAQAYAQLGWLNQIDLGRNEEAVELLHRAVAAWEQARQANPGVLDQEFGAAIAYYRLGRACEAANRLKDADRFFAEAVRRQREVARVRPDNEEYQATLASIYNSQAWYFLRVGKLSEADDALDQVRTICDARMQAHSTDLRFPAELADYHNSRGVILEQRGQTAEAQAEYERGQQLWTGLAKEHPALAEYALGVCETSCNLAKLAFVRGKPDTATDWFGQAIAAAERIHRQDEGHGDATTFLRDALEGRAMVLDKLARHADAVSDWDRALALNTVQAHAADIRRGRALSLARAGVHAKAVAEANGLAEAKNVTGGTLYDLACVCALSSAAVKDDARLQDQYAARAVELLRQAVGKGYKDIAHLKKDDDLKPLRQREDFQKLLKELEEKQ